MYPFNKFALNTSDVASFSQEHPNLLSPFDPPFEADLWIYAEENK
jgi:hypothetical protein